MLAGLDRFDEAFELHERSFQLEPESHDVRFLYGRLCFQTGRHADAIVHWERVAEPPETALPAIGAARRNRDSARYALSLHPAVRARHILFLVEAGYRPRPLA